MNGSFPVRKKWAVFKVRSDALRVLEQIKTTLANFYLEGISATTLLICNGVEAVFQESAELYTKDGMAPATGQRLQVQQRVGAAE
jgi:hypothetical protein